VYCEHFHAADFGTKLIGALAALHKSPPEVPRLLIISAHGIARTGTALRALESESSSIATTVDLAEYQRYFRVPPAHLHVLLNVCWGAYPSALNVATLAEPRPFIFGPVTNIRIKDIQKAQRRLFELLQRREGERGFERFVDDFNGRLHRRYRGPCIAMYPPDGRLYPEEAIGRLAAKGFSADLVVVQLVDVQADDVVIPIFSGLERTKALFRGQPVLATRVGPPGTLHRDLWVKFRDRDWEEVVESFSKNGFKEPEGEIAVVIEWPD
jgi:hypothetical protein